MNGNYIISELSQYGLIGVNGPDAKSFLQGQLTCHMDEVTPKEYLLGAYCNIKGRVQAIFRIFTINGTYYLRLPLDILNNVMSELKKYAMFSQVQITDATNKFKIIGFCGEQLPYELLNADNVFEIPGPRTRYEIYVSPDKTLPMTEDPEIWDLLDIQAGIPNVYAATQNEFLPHHLNLHTLGAIHFKKGCYLGQEIIARMHYKGTIKKTLKHVIEDTPFQPGDPHPAGQIVSTSKSLNGYELLVLSEVIN